MVINSVVVAFQKLADHLLIVPASDCFPPAEWNCSVPSMADVIGRLAPFNHPVSLVICWIWACAIHRKDGRVVQIVVHIAAIMLRYRNLSGYLPLMKVII